ncbi:ABC transporter ATP-binding protein [Clostridium beijerinckii]|uniref:ABC transporter ATP-binding protein n=1 Tax=Clostridium beijerinckii TaxID=1520 RepID=A0A7X9STQ9_CLOBE|nr:ABC transporter ATP-binding protein [Clostridium beijerinckii]NMF07934.1 ABC transporter ATP-binding protein [Clostridium beijerinckii]
MKKNQNKIDFLKTFLLFFKIMIRKNKLKIIVWIMLSLIVSLIPTVTLVLNRNAINLIKDITKGQSYRILITILILIGVIQICTSIMDAIKNYIYQLIKKTVDYYLYEKLYEKLTIMPLERFEDSEYYNIVLMANKAIQMNGMDNIKYIIDITSDIISIFSVICVLAVIHWSLPVALVLSMVPGFIGTIIAKSMGYNNSLGLLSSKRMETYITSLFFDKNSLKEMRIFNIKNYLIDKWRTIFHYVRNSEIKILLKESKISLIGSSSIQISTVLVSIYLVYNIYINNITLGDFVALIGSMDILKSKMGDIAMNIGELFELGLYNTSLFKIINDNDDNLVILDNLNKVEVIKSLELKNVSFKYPNSEKKVLDNVSIKIEKGQRIAIVGYNGSGKSTLINILLGNYTNIHGTYEINGIKMDNSIISKYQSRMTVILQDFIRYKLPIRDNVGFGNIEQINNDDLIKCKLDEVGLMQEVEKLPDNIDTIISKEFIKGTELSGGQWQKIAIARSMIKNSEIVIFDEPTSALDPVAELEVFNLLNDVSMDKTTIMISHRLGITKFADRIIVMKEGKIIEQGSHEELMKNDGEYKHMYETQADYYR